MMDDAIVAALLNKQSAATTYIRGKYSKEYVSKLKNKHDIDFNNPHVEYFLNYGELKNIDRTVDEHKCAFCLQEEAYGKNTELKLFQFSPPQKNTHKVINPLMVCEECLYCIMRNTAQDFESIHLDKCSSCDEPYLVTSDEYEERALKGTLEKHSCEQCLIAAGMLEEQYDQENTCVSCREYVSWSITLKQELSSKAFLCTACDILAPQNDDTDMDDYPSGGTKIAKENIFYHIQKYKDTRFAILIYSIEEFFHQRLAYDICVLTIGGEKISYTIRQYGINYNNDYDRQNVSHLQRLMIDAFKEVELSYTEKHERIQSAT
jgi:hypothetical protein